jgi:hypothetical protein
LAGSSCPSRTCAASPSPSTPARSRFTSGDRAGLRHAAPDGAATGPRQQRHHPARRGPRGDRPAWTTRGDLSVRGQAQTRLNAGWGKSRAGNLTASWRQIHLIGAGRIRDRQRLPARRNGGSCTSSDVRLDYMACTGAVGRCRQRRIAVPGDKFPAASRRLDRCPGAASGEPRGRRLLGRWPAREAADGLSVCGCCCTYQPTAPSVSSRIRSACPLWRAYSSIMWT